jgi:hypothetical protein
MHRKTCLLTWFWIKVIYSKTVWSTSCTGTRTLFPQSFVYPFFKSWFQSGINVITMWSTNKKKTKICPQKRLVTRSELFIIKIYLMKHLVALFIYLVTFIPSKFYYFEINFVGRLHFFANPEQIRISYNKA